MELARNFLRQLHGGVREKCEKSGVQNRCQAADRETPKPDFCGKSGKCPLRGVQVEAVASEKSMRGH